MGATGALVKLSPRDYEAVLFDLDGVLTPTAKVHAAAWKRLFDDFLSRRAQQTGTGSAGCHSIGVPYVLVGCARVQHRAHARGCSGESTKQNM
jgi:hypothetical protein